MRRAIAAILFLLLAGIAGGLILTSPSIQTAGTEPVATGAPDLKNGEIVYLASGCSSCHAVPGQDDKNRLGGGLKIGSPFGTFHVPNISPHPRDGIGTWTLAQFQRALRGGVSPAGEHYYPAFPYTAYQRMADADIRDLFGYMKTLPQVEGKAPGHELPFPFNVRRGLGLWKLLFLDGKPFMPDPAKSATVNRGGYLVEAMAHCAECHSPRNVLGAVEADRRYAGGPDPEGRGKIPNITPGKGGIGDWKKSDMVELLTTGFTPTFDSVGSTMADVVAHTSKLPQEDRAAIAEYILALPPRDSAK